MSEPKKTPRVPFIDNLGQQAAVMAVITVSTLAKVNHDARVSRAAWEATPSGHIHPRDVEKYNADNSRFNAAATIVDQVESRHPGISIQVKHDEATGLYRMDDYLKDLTVTSLTISQRADSARLADLKLRVAVGDPEQFTFVGRGAPLYYNVTIESVNSGHADSLGTKLFGFILAVPDENTFTLAPAHGLSREFSLPPEECRYVSEAHIEHLLEQVVVSIIQDSQTAETASVTH